MKLREYQGTGKIKFDIISGLEIDAPFLLEFNTTGRITVTATMDLFEKGTAELINSQKEQSVGATLSGILTDSGKISVTRMYVDKTNISFDASKGGTVKIEFLVIGNAVIEHDMKKEVPTTLHCGLTNFVFGGLERTYYKTRFSLNKFSASIEGREVVFLQLPEYDKVVSSLKFNKAPNVTSELILNNSTHDESEFLDNICTLLSFAGRSDVSPIYKDYYQHDTLVKSVLNPFRTGGYNPGNPLIDVQQHGNADLKEFIEVAYPNYVRVKDDLGINVVLGYYQNAYSSTYSEIRYLLAVVCIECFASHFAALSKKIGNEINGNEDLTRKEKRLDDILKKHGANDAELLSELKDLLYLKVGLRDILRSAFAFYEVDFSEDELVFTKIRQKIIHTGKFPEGINSIQTFNELTFLMDRLYLTVLGYKGKYYLDIRNQYKRVQL